MQNQVYSGEEPARLWTELVKLTNEARKMCVGENAKAHKATICYRAVRVKYYARVLRTANCPRQFGGGTTYG
jgi:hypothetical protein